MDRLKAVSRRQFLTLIGIGGLTVAGIAGYGAWAEGESLDNQPIIRPQRIGTTFSQLQCKYLNLDAKEAFLAIRGLDFGIARLCTYWNEIEVEQGKFDFSTMDWLLDASEEVDWHVILAVGMKTPRWPEFHFPDWVTNKFDTNRTDIPLDKVPGLAEATLNYTARVVEHFRSFSKIKHWQVENEAFNHAPVAGGRYLSSDFLQSEIDLVRQLINPDQKVLFTFGADPPFALQPAQQMLKPISPIVDAIGFDVYTRVPSPVPMFDYIETLPPFWWNLRSWAEYVTKNGKEAWIAESQAEPWEPNKVVAIEKSVYPSSNPNRAIRLSSRLVSLGFNPISLWGSEFWYWHRKRGNMEWWDAMEEYIGRRQPN